MIETGTTIAATGVVKGTYTSTAPTQVIAGRRWNVPAGSTVIDTFPDGLVVPATANAAIGVIPTGTGQICEVTFIWSED